MAQRKLAKTKKLARSVDEIGVRLVLRESPGFTRHLQGVNFDNDRSGYEWQPVFG